MKYLIWTIIAQVYDITQCIITEHSDIFLIAYYFKMKYFKQLYTSIQFQGFMAKKIIKTNHWTCATQDAFNEQQLFIAIGAPPLHYTQEEREREREEEKTTFAESYTRTRIYIYAEGPRGQLKLRDGRFEAGV